ncbi:MAG TPA: hypothetical protein VH370_20585 [Humisphaera sp.]|nr:hypothetical protein [Humisphaera sp.]
MLFGCVGATFQRSQSEEQMFGPSSMRIHPAFTQVKDWTGDSKPDGIEVVLEMQDQFGEPTRAAGILRFELWTFREAAAERRGTQLAQPWIFQLNTRSEQNAHWNPVERGYTFQLPFDKISADRRYVLTAQFDRPEGRLFDQLIVEPSDKDAIKGERHAVRAPTHAPGHSN